jgi:hypothetical protein
MLNSEFYKQQLTEGNIKKLYDNYRNLLIHNAVMAEGHILFRDDSNDDFIRIYDNRPHINVSGFLRISREAIDLFMPLIEEIVTKSNQLKIINLKR